MRAARSESSCLTAEGWMAGGGGGGEVCQAEQLGAALAPGRGYVADLGLAAGVHVRQAARDVRQVARRCRHAVVHACVG
eukprot:CAMPEP_0202879716 /NCGR_PEP_ID=MMETSP1391-20130828/34016_1 /ASSEMBLY_ACC=CAM_ASM_000867 /TAXON_ID=1034604 /ORGANISM="Chlamydomonas leiostraca, Strain SAG 11-49" /LENGTH=78 /DNA_ID=CAMNT_0049562115 /DNA_START=41 /DNA_END=274 /DNA_ORIENTATION=+